MDLAIDKTSEAEFVQILNVLAQHAGADKPLMPSLRSDRYILNCRSAAGWRGRIETPRDHQRKRFQYSVSPSAPSSVQRMKLEIRFRVPWGAHGRIAVPAPKDIPTSYGCAPIDPNFGSGEAKGNVQRHLWTRFCISCSYMAIKRDFMFTSGADNRIDVSDCGEYASERWFIVFSGHFARRESDVPTTYDRRVRIWLPVQPSGRAQSHTFAAN